MTVSSLWKALDRAGSGRCVGVKELQNHHRFRHTSNIHEQKNTNPWNIREVERQQASIQNESFHERPALAVDLSIWICEALTSTAMQIQVVDPALQLVYSRTLKLLNLGIKLVVVVEGKRRIRNKNAETENNGDTNGKQAPPPDKFRKRRSGAPFWSACQRCETMLRDLGVPVVRAKAEGEALCALLNQRGIVDGVISNDGDCFLFGAKVLYTKFSIENLEQSRVVRYDADDIRACLDDDDANDLDETGEKCEDGNDIVKMTRDDLIAFAILTGSDLAGDGLDQVGCRKAIRFIRKCRIDNPLKLEESPAIKELLSWGKVAARATTMLCVTCDDDDGGQTTSCGCCGHPGNKKSHKKHGCNVCGTEPGEACFPLSPGAKFRKTLRAKALQMGPAFDPSSTIELYNQPNENQLPMLLIGKTARHLEMQAPQLQSLLRSKFIIRGGSIHDSRQYIQKSVSAYMARTALFVKASDKAENSGISKLPKNSNTPTPVRISKFVTRSGVPCCEVQWIIKATLTDAEGNPMDQFEFSTIEEQSLIQKTYPDLLLNFTEEEKEFEAQGSAEQEKRRAFIASMFVGTEKENDPANVSKEAKKLRKQRRSLVEGPVAVEETPKKVKGRSDDVKALLFDVQKASKRRLDSRRHQQKTTQAQSKRPSTSYANVHLGKESQERQITDENTGPQKNEKSEQQSNKAEKAKHSRNNDALSGYGSCGDDVAKMLGQEPLESGEKRSDDSTIDTASVASCSPCVQDRQLKDAQTYQDEMLTPGHIHFLHDSKKFRRYNETGIGRFDDKSIDGWNALPQNMCDIAEEPLFDPLLFDYDKSGIDYCSNKLERNSNDPFNGRSHEFEAESIHHQCFFQDDKENSNQPPQNTRDRPQLHINTAQKRQRQASGHGVLEGFSSAFAFTTDAPQEPVSPYAQQEKKIGKRNFFQSPVLKKRKDDFQEPQAVCGNIDPWHHENRVFEKFCMDKNESSFLNPTKLQFNEDVVDCSNCVASHGRMEPLKFSGNATEHLRNESMLYFEATSTARTSRNRRPHSSSSVGIRCHRPTSTMTSRRPYSSQSRGHGVVFQDRTNNWDRTQSEVKISRSASRRQERRHQESQCETDEWYFENQTGSTPNFDNDFFEYEHPANALEHGSYEMGKWSSENDLDFMSKNCKHYWQSQTRKSKRISRRSKCSRGGRHNHSHEDRFFDKAFDEPNVLEDLFVNPVMNGPNFEQCNDQPDGWLSHRHRSINRMADEPLESRDDDSVDSEVRRRIEKKLEYTKQEVAINELRTDYMSCEFQGDGWEDFGNL